MDLRIYLYENNIKIGEFAKALEITPSYLSSLMGGKYPFSKRMIVLIGLMTKGKVLEEDLIKKGKRCL